MATKIDKAELAQRINSLEGLDNETKSQLLELLHERKQYGLVWEDKPEAAEERLQSELPILREVKERAIISNAPDAPNHILIEGDNLEALTTLSYTHEGKIDVIYIDPPYNTGNKDFVYNDSYVDTEDQFRHSKWLSFMAKRLKIAKRLLSDKGVIFISIDDNEQAQLKLLCDDSSVFGEKNCIGVVPRIAKKGSDQGTYFRPTKDYVLVYAKNIENVTGFVDKNVGIEEKKYPFMDGDREFRKGHSFYQASLDPLRGCKNQRYYMEAPDGTLIIPPGENLPIKNEDGAQIVPLTSKDKVWRWSRDSYLQKKHLILFAKSKNSPLIDSKGKHTDWNAYEKKYKDEENDEEKSALPNDVIYDFINSLGTSCLKDMGLDFSFSKPYQLIKYLLEITNKDKSATILDFFAGSGTTLHATMQLNAEDGGHRQCILVTNNENNICEEVTYERNKRVINGYTTPKGEQVEGLHANTLRYFKTDFVARESSATAKRELMYAATDMLCIKNNIYTEQPIFGRRKFRKDVCRYFQDSERSMLVIYNPDAIETIVEELQKMQIEQPILVYVFSLNDYAMDADFEDVSEKVSLCALPDAILRAYQRVLPKKQRKETAL